MCVAGRGREPTSVDSVLRFDGHNGRFINVFVVNKSGGLDGPWSLAFGPDGNYTWPAASRIAFSATMAKRLLYK
jgi:hypothetical protein